MTHDRAWTAEDTKALRIETEARFRARTLVPDILSVLPEYRVPRSEMRDWAVATLGIEPPIDGDWIYENAAWYLRMARRVAKSQRRPSP